MLEKLLESRFLPLFFMVALLSCGKYSPVSSAPKNPSDSFQETESFGWVPFDLPSDEGVYRTAATQDSIEPVERGGTPRGKVFVPATGILNVGARAALLQEDGKVVSLGFASGANGAYFVMRSNTDGHLDTSFSSQGRTMATISVWDYAYGGAIQSDGKIVAVGVTNNGVNANFGLIRFNTNGSLDTSYNTTGKISFDFSAIDQDYTGLVQADGKIVVVGVSSGGNVGVIRYNTNGSLDTSFFTNGRNTFDISGADVAYGASLQTDGKIITVGSVSSGGNFVIVRLNTDGNLDTAFNSTGKVITDVGAADNAYATLFQSDAKIIAGGNSGAQFALTRYNTDGALDTSFNTSGIITMSLSSGTDVAYGLALQPDGKVVLVGSSSGDFALIRFNTDGSLDTTFNSSGKIINNISGTDAAYGVILQTNGTIVAVGIAGGTKNIGMVRYNTNGVLDTSFFTSGVSLFNVSPGNSTLASLMVQTNGKIIAVGTTSGTSDSDVLVLRLNALGSLDTSFSTTGRIVTNISLLDNSYGGFLQTDGKAVAVLSTNISGSHVNFGLIRYNSNGSLDTSFNSSGKVNSDFSGTANDFSFVGVLQTDGKISALGTTANNSMLAVARYNTDGTVDTSFNTSGKSANTFNSGANTIYGAVLQSDGKMVGIGLASSLDVGLIRLNTDGTLDTSFNSSGKVRTDISGTDIALGGVLQQDGKILTVGVINASDFGLIRYLTDGTMDTSFNSAGYTISNISGIDTANAAIIGAGGKIVVVGTSNYNFSMVRYLSNGRLDTTFHTSGTLMMSIGEGKSSAYGVALDTSTGFYLVGGQSVSGNLNVFTIIKIAP